jgi:hypothetical protein
LLVRIALAVPSTALLTSAQVVRFPPKIGDALEIWRVTHDPAVRHYHNYHNTQCWSPDGRYLCFTRYASDGKEYGTDAAAEIHLFDFGNNQDVLIERGLNPRWANRQPWLLFNRLRPDDGPRHGRGTQVVWLDVPSGRRTVIGYGFGRPTWVSHDDRFLYGIFYPPGSRSGDAWEPYEGEPRAVRLAIRAGADLEFLPGPWGVGYNSLLVNPAHPTIVSRDHHFRTNFYATPGTTDVPFKARHFVDHGLAGENPTSPFPCMDGAHFAWSGDGEWFLPGNGPLRGRKWNEPFPANLHFLANLAVGDVGPAGRSGRWICGSTGGGTGSLRLADLRSGEGRVVMPTHSFLAFPSGRDNSGPYDIDSKGSPDGTKIAFVSTYDLQHGPAAGIAEGSTDDEIRVDSTTGFPDSGLLVNPAGFGGEVIRYSGRTPTSFRGLTRGLYGTDPKSPLRTDRMLIAFDSLLLPPEKRHRGPLPARDIRSIVKDPESPLIWQRSTDLYVAVVRRPDRPHLRARGDRIELIPGDNHWETRGYRLLCHGRPVSTNLLSPETTFPVSSTGIYTAIAVEWSGLESLPSHALDVARATTLVVLADTPADFSWTSPRWLATSGRPLAEREAKEASQATRETVHLHDGVIQRQHWQRGVLARQDDLNFEGQPIRRQTYEGGRLARREYLDRDGNLVSTELFDSAGFITESHGQRAYSQGQPAWKRDGATVNASWWYDRGVPVRYQRGATAFVKRGDRWVREDVSGR